MARRGGKLGSAVLDLDIDDSKYTSNLDKQRQKTRSWVDTLGRDVKRGIGQGIGIGAGLGVANLVADGIGMVKNVVAGSVAAAMEWESAFAGVRKTVDASETEFAELEGGIREMAREMPIAATELAGLAEAAGALGIAKGDIQEFTRVTAMIGTTTDVSSDQAATSLGQLSNVLGLTNQDYERFGSALVDLGNKGASTESQILEIASRAGAGSKLVGMATDETLAWASAVANLGIEAEAGGSSLQTFFLRSAAAIEEGGEKLDTYARIAGMTASEFKRAFQEDATGALQTFLAELGKLSQGEQLAALSDLGLKDTRITRMLLGLANNADNLGDSLVVANTAWQENIALAAEAEKRYGTTESKLQILGNRVNDLAVEFGDNLLPAIVNLATLGVEELEKFASDVGDIVQFIGYTSQVVAGHFGDMGDATNALADEMGEDFGVVNDAIARYMSETGASFEEGLEAVRRYGTGNVTALEEADDAWEAYQRQISGSTAGATAAVEEGMEGTEAALLAGEEGVGEAADQVEQAITAEMREARDNAIDAMREALNGMTNLIASEEDLTAAWEDLLERLDDPYTEAERKADTFSQTMMDTIEQAIEAGDPKITADTAALVNNMLTQFALLEPGALESGEAVPPALKEGMDTQMSALITWIEEHVTGEALTALTLTEARELGLEGIWLYAQGMKTQEENAVHQAGIIASRAVNALELDASAGGRSIIISWFGGMETAYYNNQGRLWGIVDGVKRSLGGSLPTEGPLAGGAGSGGTSIGEDWIDHLAVAIDAGLGRVRGSVGTVGDALAFSIPSPVMGDLDALTATGGFPSGFNGVPGGTNIVEYHLHYNGRERAFDSEEAFMDELRDLARFNDGANV